MTHTSAPDTRRSLSLTREIARRANERWPGARPTVVIGEDARFLDALEKTVRFASAGSPVLLTGETGTGKELFARAIYLYSQRRNRPFVAVNCAQYHDSQLMASELFGHKRGSFTGAVSDHRGVFEEANGGVVFLDEVGELSLGAQAMLLRVLSEGEVVAVGATQSRVVDVQVVAATSRDLQQMTAAQTFRTDLFYRLRYFHVHIPPVRERGDDWELIARQYLEILAASRDSFKHLSTDALRLLRRYHWPGNVREIRSVVDMGYHLSEGSVIEYDHFAADLETRSRDDQLRRVPVVLGDTDPLARMEGGESFWDVVYRPYMAREMNRSEARDVVERGLRRSRGSYKRLVQVFNISSGDYLKFMDFLRHQRLKPE